VTKQPALPLSMLTPGRPATVSHVVPGGRGVSRRLAAMGVMPGIEVTVLSSQNGPVLLRVGDSRFAIGRGMAHKVMVKECG